MVSKAYSQDFLDFCKEYGFNLNEQQSSAVESVTGANLLVAVPGSGKTTVLVARLGYMLIKKGISPEEILAMTYTTAAAADMKERFALKFGKALAERLQFRTINSVCYEIILYYARVNGSTPYAMIDDKTRTAILRGIYQKITSEYPTDVDIQTAELTLTFIKNMMLSKEEMKKVKTETPSPAVFYEKYDEILRKENLMDFDDQMRYSIPILRDNPRILEHFQAKFKYICVDEAQDTSKLQHLIIRILSRKHNNVFMVGDEDQSIYGFRAAYPKALMDFKKDYPNANVLFMEKNYRSKEEIVRTAAKFIAKNKNRYKKEFVGTQGTGGTVKSYAVPNREAQYSEVLKIAKKTSSDRAILYRDNDCAIPILDMFLRNDIPYNISKVKDTFFTHRSVMDIKAFISLALNPKDTEAFMQIYYKCGFGFNKPFATKVKKLSLQTGIPIPQIMKKESANNPQLYSMSQAFERLLLSIKVNKPYDAIDVIRNKYEGYLKKNNIGTGKLEILKNIAKPEKSLKDFLDRLDNLPELIRSHSSKDKNAIILSTIHSAKGLEYDTVYLIDVIDGIFPSVELSLTSTEAEKELYEEERRLFYVGITRAKRELYLFDFLDKNCSFVTEIAPSVNVSSEKPNLPLKYGTEQPSAHRLTLGKSNPYSSSKPQLAITESSADSVQINGCYYNAGALVEHKIFGVGRISEMSLIANDSNRHQVKIDFQNGTTGKYELEILIRMNLLKIHRK